MDPSLQPLLDRLVNLSGRFKNSETAVQEAIKIADISPEMALTRSRKVPRYLVRDVYERRISEPPGTRPLENLLQRLVKDGFFPDRLDAYANTIRKLGNVGTHTFGEKVEVADVYKSLAQLMPILEWYFEAERRKRSTDIHPGYSNRRKPTPSARNSTVAAATAAPHLAIVPKGLRSFDGHDADFFLDLLPGPRDKDSLPESIRFWKTHAEDTDPDLTFSVGLIYGPSGCGKSSLVKAGLLPRLASHVLPCTSMQRPTTPRSGCSRACENSVPHCRPTWDLKETMAALRLAASLPAGKKMLIVIDQFEQWLHAKRDEQNSRSGSIPTAMRRPACAMHPLGARRFLDGPSASWATCISSLCRAKISRWLTCSIRPCPQRSGSLWSGFRATRRTIAERAERIVSRSDRRRAGRTARVISVRLALFAEMVKGRPWTLATLKAVGGTAGVGVSFLEETFSSAVADRKNRRTRMPPEGCSRLCCRIRERTSKDTCGRTTSFWKPRDMPNILRNSRNCCAYLDGELRLITPTDSKAVDPKAAEAGGRSGAVQVKKYYQLTHDYLVHSLRDWLTRKQRETRRGRAELRLANRAAAWNEKPENRNLPSFWEYLNIGLLTKRKTWTPIQLQMMHRAADAWSPFGDGDSADRVDRRWQGNLRTCSGEFPSRATHCRRHRRGSQNCRSIGELFVAGLIRCSHLRTPLQPRAPSKSCTRP